MIMASILSRRLPALFLGCALACALTALAAPSARAQTIAVMVNGEPITDLDIEQRSKLNFISTHKQQSRQ
jgi:peptidyl-prolyl cis-trans isomerase SurA